MPKLVHCAVFFLGQARKQISHRSFAGVFIKHAPLMLAHRDRPLLWTPEDCERATRDAVSAVLEAADAAALCGWTAEAVKDQRDFKSLWFCYGNVCSIVENLAREKYSTPLILALLKLEERGRKIGLKLGCAGERR